MFVFCSVSLRRLCGQISWSFPMIFTSCVHFCGSCFILLSYDMYDLYLVCYVTNSTSLFGSNYYRYHQYHQFSVSVCLVITSLQRFERDVSELFAGRTLTRLLTELSNAWRAVLFSKSRFHLALNLRQEFQGMHFRSQVCIARSLNTSKFILFATELWSDRRSVFSHDKSCHVYFTSLILLLGLYGCPMRRLA